MFSLVLFNKTYVILLKVDLFKHSNNTITLMFNAFSILVLLPPV